MAQLTNAFWLLLLVIYLVSNIYLEVLSSLIFSELIRHSQAIINLGSHQATKDSRMAKRIGIGAAKDYRGTV